MYTLHLEVQNEKRLWRRDCDARDVVASWYAMDKNHEQWSAIHNVSVSPYLLAGVKGSKEITTNHLLIPEGNPRTFIVVVKCREGALKREIITYYV